MSWTDERVELLRQLWLDGKSASQISNPARPRRDPATPSIGKVHRLGLAGAPRPRVRPPPRRAPPQRRACRPVPPRAAPARWCAARTRWRSSAEPALDMRPVFQEDDIVVPMSLRVTIVDLKEAMCRWPLGDPTSSEFRYCGSPSASGPYCAHHGRLAYQPVQDRRRERERERRALMLR